MNDFDLANQADSTLPPSQRYVILFLNQVAPFTSALKVLLLTGLCLCSTVFAATTEIKLQTTITPTQTSASLCHNTVDRSAGLLWRVQKEVGPPDFVFGTMHQSGEWVEEIVKALEPWLSQTQSLFVEIDNSQFTPLEMIDRALLPDGVLLNQFFSDQEYQQVQEAVGRVIPEHQLSHMKPWYVFINLQAKEEPRSEIMDTLLQKRFEEQNLPVFGLETVTEQVLAYDSLSLSEQAWLVRRALATVDSPFLDFDKKLKVLYQHGRLRQLWYALDVFSNLMGEDFTTFNTSMLAKRNAVMAKKILKNLDNSSHFIAVGAFHLPGEQGLLCLLEKQGYQISAESFGFSPQIP